MGYMPSVHHDHQQPTTNIHDDEHHHDDSMLELKDYDQNVPSNFAVVSGNGLQQTGNPSKENVVSTATPPTMMPHQPSLVQYYPPQSQLPSQHPEAYPMNNPQIMMMPHPTSNNYIMNHGHVMTTAIQLQHSYNPEIMTSKYSTWTRVVLAFAILLTIYGVFQLATFFFAIYATSMKYTQVEVSVSSLVMQAIATVLILVSGSIGIYSTITKNIKRRKYSTIAHLISLALLILIMAIETIIAHAELKLDNLQFPGKDSTSMLALTIFSAVLSLICVLACCGSCLGCQAYRLTIIKSMTAVNENGRSERTLNPSQEGFVRMNDEEP
ncbi:hypothetical protein C9374_007082 [Naegleria lovaniensis]|uniref:Uncharacterized protein n=1 Tax=Naegleria lovaniensis TaxID=51637 RepID=A0AA88H6J9_NAELO|nr:uncharacterized protein C9374_007082 [Naegleria lovaniensis]KAG2393551.1 hypothetical protein C9374_007082 [Naegleria lovaniensis]